MIDCLFECKSSLALAMQRRRDRNSKARLNGTMSTGDFRNSLIQCNLTRKRLTAKTSDNMEWDECTSTRHHVQICSLGETKQSLHMFFQSVFNTALASQQFATQAIRETRQMLKKLHQRLSWLRISLSLRAKILMSSSSNVPEASGSS